MLLLKICSNIRGRTPLPMSALTRSSREVIVIRLSVYELCDVEAIPNYQYDSNSQEVQAQDSVHPQPN
jgi:hypothetical protein